MKHFLIKNSLTLKGSGGKPAAPQPPVVTQFPSVLAPPQFGSFNSINSFSYAEMIDLIADGPIEGLINKNGRKVYDENIFEGIYLNDTAIKETSSIETQYVSVGFLKKALKRLWNTSVSGSFPRSLTLNPFDRNDIDDVNFNSNISLTYYHPDDSVAKFISLMRGDLSSSLLIKRAFDLSPIRSEKPFLTVITIPQFRLFLDKNKFDESEGGNTSPSPITLGISNLSEYFYFSVGYDSLNLFNYFELPRSFVINNLDLASGKKTFAKLKKDNALFLEYEASSINILIWSIYNTELDKPKNFDVALDKYFNNLVVFQNKTSLFNYNLVSSEFRHGSELQTPFKGFSKTEIDIEIGKELIGPYKTTNNFSPGSAFDAGGVQRLTSYSLQANSPPPVNLDLTQETSDDIRFIKNWPVEYDQNGDPYIIQNARSNYSQFDKTSTSRSCSEAVPITHYISNQNVEEVYVTLNINQLNDTNHIDLVSSTNAIGLKSKYTESTPQGTPTYSQLPGIASVQSSEVFSKYFLIFGSSISDGVILAGNNTITGLFQRIPSNINMEFNSPLYTYMLPTPDSSSIKTLSSRLYINDPNSFERLLKLKNSDFGSSYEFSLDDNERLSPQNYFKPYSFPVIDKTNPDFAIISTPANVNNPAGLQPYVDYPQGTNFIKNPATLVETTWNYQRCTIFNSINENNKAYGKFSIATVDYFSVSTKNFDRKHAVSVLINQFIPYQEIFQNWQIFDSENQGVAGTSVIIKIDTNRYPNINRYIIEPFVKNGYPKIIVGVNTILLLQYLRQAYAYAVDYTSSSIGWIVLLGLNYNYLTTQNSFWNGGTLKLTSLETLLANFGHVFNSLKSNINSSLVTTNALQNSLKKVAQGKLISDYNLKSYSFYYYSSMVPFYSLEQTYNKNFYNITDKKVETYGTTAKYNTNYIYLYDQTKNNVNLLSASDSPPISFRGIIIVYDLTSNQSVSNLTSSLVSNVKYGIAKAGTVTPNTTSATIPTLTQQLTAGSKLPAVVSVKVETGYEGKEQQQKYNTDEYFAYQYDIYGLASDQALVDIGRTSQDYVYSKKINSETGGYFQQIKNQYTNGLKLYLYKITLMKNYSPTYYYLLDSQPRRIGKLIIASLANQFIANTTFGVTVLTGDSPVKNIGLRQTILQPTDVSGLSSQNINEAKWDDYNSLISNWINLTSLNEFLLTETELNTFFTNNLKTLNLAQAIAYLKQTKQSKSLFPVDSYPSDSYVQTSPASASTLGYDRYEIYYDAAYNLSIDLYTFTYNIYNTIDISSGAVVPIANTAISDLDSFVKTDLYLTIYRERAHDAFSFFDAATKAFPEDAFLYLVRNSDVNVIARFSRTPENTNNTLLDRLANVITNIITVAGYLGQIVNNFINKF